MNTTTKLPPTDAHMAALHELRSAYAALQAAAWRETTAEEDYTLQVNCDAAQAHVAVHEAMAEWENAKRRKIDLLWQACNSRRVTAAS
jgi:hypothetical protein